MVGWFPTIGRVTFDISSVLEHGFPAMFDPYFKTISASTAAQMEREIKLNLLKLIVQCIIRINLTSLQR
jgi:hypothetical protein